MIFLDMDETLTEMIFWLRANFPEYPDIWNNKEFFQSKIYEEEILSGLFLKLPPRQDMMELINFIVLNNKRHSILSNASIYRPDLVKLDKKRWLELHHPYFNKIEGIHFTAGREEKSRYARMWLENENTTPVLIDDEPVVCEYWREQGGVAIQYKDTRQAVAEYNKLLKEGTIIE